MTRVAVPAAVGILLAGALAGAALAAPSPIGTWKLDGRGWHYRWAAIAGGGFQETALTRHYTAKNHCLVAPPLVVYRYRPIGGGLYREEQLTWRQDCTTYWDTNRETDRFEVTATRLKVHCSDDKMKVCWSYHRIDVTAPHVRALASTGTVGGATDLRYLVGDDSGRTWEILTIYRNGKPTARYRTTLGPAREGRIYAYRLDDTPASYRGTFRFCVQSRDAAGNVSKTSCAAVTIRG